MNFRSGDRVRIIKPNSEYTGCRGTIASSEGDAPAGVTALGYEVAIDGENGVARPFLVGDLEVLRAVRVRSRAQNAQSSEVEGGPPGR